MPNRGEVVFASTTEDPSTFEETARRVEGDGGSEREAPPAEKPEKSASASEEEKKSKAGEESEETGETEEVEEEPKSRRSEKVERRIKKLARARAAAETERDEAVARADKLQEELDAIRSGGEERPTTRSSKGEGRPRVEEIGTKYADHEAYVEALAEWTVEQKLRSHEEKTTTQQRKMERDRQQREQERAIQQMTAAFARRADEFAAATPDYDEVVQEAELRVPKMAQFAIMKSELGPQLVYYLATHPKDEEKLQQMGEDGGEIYKFIGKLEDRVTAKPPSSGRKPVTKAPDPPEPVKTTRTAPELEPLPGGENYAPWRDKRNADERGVTKPR